MSAPAVIAQGSITVTLPGARDTPWICTFPFDVDACTDAPGLLPLLLEMAQQAAKEEQL